MSNTKDIKKQYNDFNERFSESIAKDDNISRNAFYKSISFDLRNKKLLDLACGDGQDILEYQKRGAICEGIDASDDLIATAQKNFPEVTFMVGDMSKLPYENNIFDVVFSKYAIGTEADVNKVFSEVFRILKSGGIFMYLTTHPMRLFLEQGDGKKDYFTQKLVDLVVYGGKFTITEPSHTFNDFFTQDFFNMFDMLAFSEHYDPQSADFPGRDVYPDFFIVTAQKK